MTDGSGKLGSIETSDSSDMDLFRNVHICQPRPAIRCIVEAKALLSEDPDNAKALQYVGWWNLCHSHDYDNAKHFLRRSVASGMFLSSHHSIMG